MVVCKFFQQGYCRYGQNCRFDHIYGSKYSYHAPQNNQPLPPAAPAGFTDEQLVKLVQAEVHAALKGGQWILSSYAPFKEKPALPGISDLSPEEARLFIYEAKANNNVDQAVAYMNNLIKETTCKLEQLLQPTPSIIKVLRSLYQGEVVTSPFSNVNTGQSGFGGSNSSASVFRNAAQNTSVFAQQPSNNAASIFGQKANSVFGPSSSDSAKSLFSQATQNVFGSSPQNAFGSTAQNAFGQSIDNVAPIQNVFGQSNDNVAAKSLFALANQNFGQPVQQSPTNVFANAAQQLFGQPTDVFKQASPFQSAPAPAANVFQQAQHASNIFAVATPSEDDSKVYSKPEELSQEDMEAYTSDNFTLGFIPELPPPQSLCV